MSIKCHVESMPALQPYLVGGRIGKTINYSPQIIDTIKNKKERLLYEIFFMNIEVQILIGQSSLHPAERYIK